MTKEIQLEITNQENGNIDVQSKIVGEPNDIETNNMVLGGIRHLMLIYDKKCARVSWENMDGVIENDG